MARLNSYFPGGSDGKASVYSVGDLGSISPSGRFPGEGNGNPLQYSCLENPMEGGAWCRLLSMGSQRVRHDGATSLHFWGRKVGGPRAEPLELVSCWHFREKTGAERSWALLEQKDKMTTYFWNQEDLLDHTCAEKILRVSGKGGGTSCQPRRDFCVNPSWLKDMHAHLKDPESDKIWAISKMIGQRKPGKSMPSHKQFKSPQKHDSLSSSMYSFHMYSASNKRFTHLTIFCSLMNSFFKEDKDWGPLLSPLALRV